MRQSEFRTGAAPCISRLLWRVLALRGRKNAAAPGHAEAGRHESFGRGSSARRARRRRAGLVRALLDLATCAS